MSGSIQLRQSPSHIPALDGFRGLAIALVLFCHLTVLNAHTRMDSVLLGLANRAWVGVDLFFVLSGFLITGILFDAKGSGGYFRNFYGRRTLRIFPLYYAVVFMTLVILPRLPLGVAREYGRLDGHSIWYWLYLSNFHQASVGHFTNKVLGLSWSLAIEEQFYLLWPAIVFLFSRRTLLRICGTLVAAALATRLGITFLGTPNDMNLYVLTPCRMDGLAIGAFIALAIRQPAGVARLLPWARLLLPVSLAIALPLWKFELQVGGKDVSDSLLYTFLDLACGSLLVLVLAAPSQAPLQRFFSNRFLQSLGRYSYALYLLHYPIATLLRDHGLAPGRIAHLRGSEIPGQLVFYVMAGTAAFAAALASWHLFEKHFLKLKRLFPSARPSAPVTAGAPAGRAPVLPTAAGGPAAQGDPASPSNASSAFPASVSTAAAQ